MDILTTSWFPLGCGFLFMVLAGGWEYRTYLVPNKLVLASLIGAFGLSLIRSQIAPQAAGGIGATLWCTVLAGIMLWQPYIRVRLGAGCVKAHASFGSWVGCGFGYVDGSLMIAFASVIAAVFTVLAWRFAVSGQRTGLPSEPEPPAFLHGQLPLSAGTLIGILAWSAL